MATVKEMKATARPKSGKGAARAERRAGRTPAVIYGDNKPPLAISVDHKDVRTKIYAGRFLTTLYNIDVDGEKHRVIPRDFQLDPVKDYPVHVDFLRVGRRRDDPRQRADPRPGRRQVAGRQARRRGQHRLAYAFGHGAGGVDPGSRSTSTSRTSTSTIRAT